MELYTRILEIIDANLIYCLVPIILTLYLCEVFFKNRFETRKTLNLVRWSIIIYTAIIWTYLLIEITQTSTNSRNFDRLTGDYAFAYWTMHFSSLILPFTLVFRKLAMKYWYILIVSIGLKLGAFIEKITIIITSQHRDFLTQDDSSETMYYLMNGIGITILQGVFIATIILAIFEFINEKKTAHNKR